MAGIRVGSVSVDVVPDASRFATTLRADLLPIADGIARDIGRQMADRISPMVRDSIMSGMSQGGRAAAVQGSSAGGSFADGFKARVTAALRNLPAAKVGADATQFDAELEDIRARMAALSEVRIGVDLQAADAVAELDSLQGRLVALGEQSPDVQVRVDTAAASAELARFSAQVAAVDGETIDVDTAKAGSGLSGMLTTVLALGPALIPIGAAATAGLAGIATVAGSAAGGLGVVALAFSGVTKAMQTLGTEAANPTAANLEKVRQAFAKLSPAGREFAVFVQSQLVPAFDHLKAAAQAGLLPGVEAGLQAMMPLLPPLTGFVGNLAHTLGNLADEAGHALDTPFWRGFFDYVSTTAGPTLSVLGHVVGDVAKGFAGLMEAFAPVVTEMGAGIEHLAGDFAAFGAGAGSSAGFQHFLAYVESEGPGVVHALGDIAAAAGHLIVALAPIGGAVLTGLQGLADVIHAIPIPVLTGIAAAILAIVVAMKAANLATSTWEKTLGKWGVTGGAIGVGIVAIGVGLSYAHKWFEQAGQDAQQLKLDLASALGDTSQSFTAWSTDVSRVFNDAGEQAAAFGAQVNKVGNFTEFDALRHPIETIKAFGAAATDAGGKLLDLQASANHALGNVERLTATFLGAPTNAAMGQMLTLLSSMGVTSDDLAGNFGTLQGKVQDYLSSADNATAPTLTLQQALAQLGGNARDAQADVEALTTAISDLIGGPLAEHQNAVQFADDLRAMAKAAASSTGKIDDNTKAGEANAKMVQTLASDVLSSVASWTKNGDTVDQIRPKLLAMEKQLRGVVEQTVGNKKAADDYLRSMHLLPNQIGDVVGSLGKVPKAADGAANGMKSGGSKAVDAARAMARGMKRALDPLESEGRQGGRDFGAGLVLGLQREMGAVSVQAKILADQVAKQMRLAHDSHSPSRVAIAIGEDFGAGLVIGLDRWAARVMAAAQRLADATTKVLRGISRAVAPAVTDPAILARVYGRDKTAAIDTRSTAMAKTAHAEDLQDIVDDLTTVSGKTVRSLVDTAKAADNVAGALGRLNHAKVDASTVEAAQKYAKHIADLASNAHYAAAQMDSTTKAERAAKAAAEDHARTLSHEAREASNAAAKIKDKYDTLTNGAQKAAAAAQRAADKATQAAQAAAQKAQEAAQSLVTSLSSSVDAMLQEVTQFQSSLAAALVGDDSIGTLWQQLTDAGTATVANLQGSLDTILGNVQKFGTDLSALTAAGASKDLVAQIAQMGPVAGDALAQQLLAAGSPAITALSTTMTSISDYALGAADTLAESFYGPGVTAMGKFIAGLQSQNRELRNALQPLIDEINSVFAAAGLAEKGVKVAAKATPLPAAAAGVTNFAGGYILVGENGPEIVTLPSGSDVTPLTYNGATVTLPAASYAESGTPTTVATLAPEDRALLRSVVALADRPVSVKIGQREIAESVNDYSRDRRLHGDPAW